ncbi:MAG: hypothetical protein QOE68_2914 [Thermoanaerobaculia bacterium]|jgi:hypothetical protein|nr:hypothetical protein [Thermoanaerobaculia bacterium]
MTNLPSDETERLSPDKDVLRRRRERDARIYRDWCESSYGPIKFADEVFHPADILDALAPDAARRGRDDAMAQAKTDIEQIVCEQFPAPIAVPFHGFIEGPRQAISRLHRLRDTWESLVRLLTAVAMSEAAASGIQFACINVRESADQGWRPCKRRDLFSDKLSVRIGLIEGILQRANDLGATLKLTSLIPLDVLGEVRRLNVVRNGFSHEAAKSDAQAQAIIDDAYPVLRELLLDLRDLQTVELMRVRSLVPGNKAEIEWLIGHAQSRRFSVLELDQQAASVAMSAASVDGLDPVLARIDGLMLDLSPFVYAADDDTGHRTRVFEFKSKTADLWALECVADSTTRSSPCAPHENLLGRFQSFFEDVRGGV